MNADLTVPPVSAHISDILFINTPCHFARDPACGVETGTLFGKGHEPDFTFMEVWNLIVIISVLRIQC